MMVVLLLLTNEGMNRMPSATLAFHVDNIVMRPRRYSRSYIYVSPLQEKRDTIDFQTTTRDGKPLPTTQSNTNDKDGSTSTSMEGNSFGSSLVHAATDAAQELYCAINLDDLTAPFLSPMDSESTFVEYTEDGVCVPAGPVGQFKETLANLLEEPIVELTIAASVMTSSCLVALSTVDSLGPQTLDTIRILNNWVGIIFCLDFAGRWFSSSAETGRHILNPQFPVDLVVVVFPLLFGMLPSSLWAQTWIPSWLTSPSGLFNLELLRVLRLRRVLRDIESFRKFERALGIVRNNTVQEWQLQLARVVLSLVTLLSVASGLIYTVEHDINPGIQNYFDALYFGLTTLTTVGFGGMSVGKKK